MYHEEENTQAEEQSSETVIPREQAEKEVETWLKAKKVSDVKREAYKGNISSLVEAISKGHLTLDSENRFTHHLLFPVTAKDKVFLEQLVYKPRATVEAINTRMKGISLSEQPTETQLAYASALTGQAVALLGKLDTEDLNIMRSIVVFFI